MPRALARSAYGTSRRIGEAGASVARLESLILLNTIPVTFALPHAWVTTYTPSNPKSDYGSVRLSPNIPELPIPASAETAWITRLHPALCWAPETYFDPTFYVEGVLDYCGQHAGRGAAHFNLALANTHCGGANIRRLIRCCTHEDSEECPKRGLRTFASRRLSRSGS